MCKFNVGYFTILVSYNPAGINYSAVVSSKDLFQEHCLLHLEDSNGTYCRMQRRIYYTRYSPSCVLILIPFKKLGWGTRARQAGARRRKRLFNRLCKILWYHMEVAQSKLWASGSSCLCLQSRPISTATDYVTSLKLAKFRTISMKDRCLSWSCSLGMIARKGKDNHCVCFMCRSWSHLCRSWDWSQPQGLGDSTKEMIKKNFSTKIHFFPTSI